MPVRPRPTSPREPATLTPRDFDAKAYKARKFFDILFNYIKRFRRIATRYEKLGVRYGAMLTLTAILIWLA